MFSELILVGTIFGIVITIYFGSFYNPRSHPSRRAFVQDETSSTSPVSTYNPIFDTRPWQPTDQGNLAASIDPATIPADDSNGYNARSWINRESTRTRLPPSMFQGHGMTSENIVQQWRKSIVGLIRLAEKNLESARQHMESAQYSTAILAACTSVENVSCALIHCYGGKPEPTRGQEEPLRILSRRLNDDERYIFESAIDSIALIDNESDLLFLPVYDPQREALDRISFSSLSSPFASSYLKALRIHFLGRIKAKWTIQIVSETVKVFKKIITTHFAGEIQELQSVPFSQ